MLQLQVSNFKSGSYLVVDGKEASDKFYIIQQGTVECFKSAGTGIPPAMLGPGDFVGVVPCMAGRSQIETAIANSDVVALAIRKEQYPELIEKNTVVALKIIKTFANRMRVLNEMLTTLALHSVSTTSYEQIFNVAQHYEKAAQSNIAVFAYYQYLKTRPQGPNAEVAKERFVALKQKTHAVYFEPTTEMTRMYPKDTMVFSEAQPGADMFIIQAGEVAITKIVDGNAVTLAVLKKGDIFGEMALIENKPRSASAIAHNDCQLMVINRSNFNQMVASQPQLIARLTTTLADRLWSMYRQLDNATLDTPLAKMIDMLYLQIEKQKIAIGPTKQPYQTDFSPKDLVNMCAIPEADQPAAFVAFQQSPLVSIVGGKILIKDLRELPKEVSFLHKQKPAF